MQKKNVSRLYVMSQASSSLETIVRYQQLLFTLGFIGYLFTKGIYNKCVYKCIRVYFNKETLAIKYQLQI